MNDQMNTNAPSYSADDFDRFDVVAIEWRAREMRAAFLTDALRGLARRAAERARALRGAGTGAAHTV